MNGLPPLEGEGEKEGERKGGVPLNQYQFVPEITFSFPLLSSTFF